MTRTTQQTMTTTPISPETPKRKNVFAYIPMRPVPKGRPRRSASGGMFTDRKTREFEKAVSLYCKEAMKNAKLEPLQGPILCEIYMDDEECSISVSEYDAEKSKLRGDIDNYVKALLDGANGILFEDDKQIHVVLARKV